MQSKTPAPAGGKTDAARDANRRRIYVNMRIEELRAELAKLVEERKALNARKP